MSVTPSPIGGFAAQFFDNNGVILSGGKIYTYAAGGTTPQATYTSASGVTAHANPIILDSAGRVPGGEIWLTDGLVYKFVIETATSILLGTYDNITGVNSNFVNYTVQEEVITATAGQTVFNLTTINYTPGTNSLTVYIDGVNQYVGDSYLETDSDTVTFTSGVHVGGEVKFTTAIQTSPGATDASNVSYDPPFVGGVPTTVENRLAQYVSVKDFGAVGDGVANDTAAFNAAIAWANAKGGSDRDNIKGSTIFIPEGRYKITSSLNPITVSSVCFQGASQASAVIVSSVSGAMFRFGDATLTNLVVGGGIQNLSIEYPVDPTGVGTCVVALDYAFSTYFRNINLNRAPTFLRLGETSTRVAGGVQVDNLSGSIANSGYPAFNVRHGAGLNVSNSGLFVRGVLAPVNPNPMTTVAGTIVFACGTGSWDTIQVSNCIFERFDQGFAAVAGASTVVQNVFFSNTIFDYCRRHAVYLEANGVSAAIVTVQFNETCWLNSWEEDSAALIRVDGVVDNVLISGSSAISGKRAVYYDVSNALANKIINMTINGANRLGTVQGAIVVAANSTGFTLSNIQGNTDTSGWTRPDYGVVVLGNCDRYTVTNCALFGPIGGYSFAVNASGSKNRLVYGNVNAAYATTATTAIPASGVTYVNTTGFTEEWIFSGGTITGGYSKNGVGISGALASLTMQISPGEQFEIGYSVAPTAVKSVSP